MAPMVQAMQYFPLKFPQVQLILILSAEGDFWRVGRAIL